ncbi:hypothetical protein BVRB_6g141690 [Beta vulgaris subsp. vulgaris]|nr:hypothetical protein BVRB_6g141690 [Beta vulgaris subsp. vulgaris]
MVFRSMQVDLRKILKSIAKNSNHWSSVKGALELTPLQLRRITIEKVRIPAVSTPHWLHGCLTEVPALVKVDGAWKRHRCQSTWRAAIAWHIWWDSCVYADGVMVATADPQHSEYCAILKGLREALKHSTSIMIYTDSLLAVQRLHNTTSASPYHLHVILDILALARSLTFVAIIKVSRVLMKEARDIATTIRREFS